MTGTPFDNVQELLSSYGEHVLLTDQGRHLALLHPAATSQHVFGGQRAAWPLIFDEWENPQALREYRKDSAGYVPRGLLNFIRQIRYGDDYMYILLTGGLYTLEIALEGEVDDIVPVERLSGE